MTTLENFDMAQTFQLDGLDVRGRLVRLGPALDEVLNAHGYPDVVADMLAQTLVLGATLASALKYDGLFTLQVQSDGPISLLVADLTSDGELRGYARYDDERVAQAALEKGAVVPRLLGNGHLAFTVDQGDDMERYQGVVALEGATLAACAQTYFRDSEQLETVIFLGSETGSSGNTAGAVMVQRMPKDANDDGDTAEEDWRRVVVLLASLKLEELLDPTLEIEQILYRLYHEDGIRAFDPKGLTHKCRCSREKVVTTIKSFPRDEVVNDEGSAHVNCEFCTTDYDFSPADLDEIYDKTDDETA